MAAQTTAAGPSTTTSFVLPSSSPVVLGKSAIVWLSIVGVILVIVMSVVFWLLLRYTCTKAGRRRGAQVEDGRNRHREWWKHANAPVYKTEDGDSTELRILTHDAATVGTSVPKSPSEPVLMTVPTVQRKGRGYAGTDDGFEEERL
ncbi:hypothetical protein M8818_002803 [Zalaria obscura]|uniref:Uncharacterized protein n=1 Tax=Zalaria obscura TaxID=2024903 RepID=A0ACC3SHH7_9PEZI